MIDALLAPFHFAFMQQAFLLALLVAIPCAILSCIVVLKGWSLMGDAIAHAVLPGLILAYLLAIPFAIGAFIAALCCASATGYISKHSRIKQDTAMGVVFSVMFALGLLLMTKVETGLHLDHLLYGDLLAAHWALIIEIAIVATIIIAVLLLQGKDLVMVVFDTCHAQVIGLNTQVLHYGLLALLSMLIVSALQAVGMILVIALLIAPGAIAFMLCSRFATMMATSLGIASFASMAGVYVSFYLDSAPAPTIILLLSVLFVVSFTVQLWRNQRLLSLENSPKSNLNKVAGKISLNTSKP
ncbi:metal ABC transporter permease [Motilimonas pumila]|uniref:Metal ABC transporter permease n=1 Tax=Motilimonas pumila TaxID=2303987 RepID=A0A418YD40_9GAMM|nr:metal ABC transporter permease [Motilimonas pumila]RJG42440.1 metal ABC transporter permease [Motilimonas pumila]